MSPVSTLGEGWGEGLSVDQPSHAPLSRPFSQGEKADIQPGPTLESLPDTACR